MNNVDLGKWCNISEVTKSQTAIRKGIKNIPSEENWKNIEILIKNIYSPVCNHFGRKIPISSFFRSIALNKAVGGSSTSQHVEGRAVDLDCDGVGVGITNQTLFEWIRKNLSFDQLIYEFPDDNGNPSWVHVSFVSFEKNRKQCLKAVNQGKKTIYVPI